MSRDPKRQEPYGSGAQRQIVSSDLTKPAWQPACPQCERGHGIPIAVTAGKGTTVVRFRCADCLHEWDLARDEPSALPPDWPPEER
jgi:hypothetical protein